MISALKNICCCFCILLSTFNLAGQQYLSVPVSNNTKYYEGRIDDVTDVKIQLNCTANACFGELLYSRSGARFTLKGKQQGKHLVLEEYDEHQQLTGLLNGQQIGNGLIITWENTAKTIGSKIYLQKVDFATKSGLSNCGDNKWIQAYKGKIKNKPVEIILQKMANNQLIGSAYFVKDRQECTIRGEMTGNDNLQLQLYDTDTGKKTGTILAISRDKKALSITFYDEQNTQSFTNLELTNAIGINCLAYADYYSHYDFTYPKSDDVLFNHIMAFLTKNWIADCKNKTAFIHQERAAPALRASQRSYTWTEINLYTNDFISGFLTHDNTWQNQKESKSFNYDFANRSSIELEDIFKAGFDYKTYIKEYIQESLKKQKNYQKDVSYQAWVSQQHFEPFTIGREGLHFFTDFHIVYGRQSVLVPYKKLKSKIKKQAAIRRLF